tara:strand:- start:2237 stop:2443 length:207 start_codon:yes stop_codon:yes gene_type:complete
MSEATELLVDVLLATSQHREKKCSQHRAIPKNQPVRLKYPHLWHQYPQCLGQLLPELHLNIHQIHDAQ